MEAQAAAGTFIDIPSLPDISFEEMDFLDTSFFKSNGTSTPQLPSPADVKQKYPHFMDGGGRGVVKLEDLGLVVKAGHSDYLRLEEAQTLRAIRRAFPSGEVPVPELFGWRKVGKRVFIYMSLIPGEILRDAWESFTATDKSSVCDQLAGAVAALRRLKQHSSSRFIGSINGGHVQDRFFKLDYEQGPFPTIAAFNDWVGATATKQKPGLEVLYERDIYRDFVPDVCPVYFTHGDLTLTNVIISGGPGAWKIAGIVDWEQSGWHPEYWEYCKMLYGIHYEHEFRADGWSEKVMAPFEEASWAFFEYSSWRGHP